MPSVNKKGIAAFAAGVGVVALLVGNTTIAQWSDSATVDGGVITSGNLDVAALENVTWQDVSPDTDAAGTAIDLAAYRIVPGDVIEGSQDLDVALQGDNMKATLTFANATTGEATDLAQLLAADNGVTLTYTVTDEAGTAVVESAPVGGANEVINLTPTDVPVAVDGIADYNVTLRAAFDVDTPDRVRTQTAVTLGETTATLQQVRA